MVYMKERKKECTNQSRCKYLHVSEMYDTWKEKFNVWNCTCEDEEGAGCIPTYEGVKLYGKK